MTQPHKPTETTRELVKSLSGFGVPQDDICVVLDVSLPTLHKYYRRECDLGFAQANAKVGESLFKQATSGNTSAAIFWMKARAGWREKQEIDHSSSDGTMSPPSVIRLVGPDE
jgi:hypothetical protein